MLSKKMSVFFISIVPTIAYADYNENLLEKAYDVMSQIYEQQNLDLSLPICTSDECTSNITENGQIIGFASTTAERNLNSNAIKFSYKEYNYDEQKYSYSFLVVLENGENKYYTDESIANYSFNNGVLAAIRKKRGFSFSCTVSFDSDKGNNNKGNDNKGNDNKGGGGGNKGNDNKGGGGGNKGNDNKGGGGNKGNKGK